ncbi:MAG: phosphotransferase [Acidimicrobiales bacterium]
MTSGRVPIADTPEALTPEWLTDALTHAGMLDGARITGAELRPLGTGQMCDSVRVALTYDRPVPDAAPATLVAKLPAADATSRGTALSLRSYEKEVRFYQHLAPHLPIRTPAAYHADIDVTTAAFVLLLEDMAPAVQGDQLAGCTPDEAVVATRELVGLHAPRWGDPGLAGLDWLANDPEQARAMVAALLPALWDGFRERYAADIPPHVHQAGDVLFTHLEAYMETPDAGTRTIVHGDYRLDNLLFDASPGGTPLAVVDWQTCAAGTGAFDVAYFVGAGLDEHDRRAVEEDLVRGYHDGLVAAGVDYAWDRCWHDYRRGTWAGLLMAVGASMMVERTGRGDRMFLTMAARHARHALDLEAPDLLTAG